MNTKDCSALLRWALPRMGLRWEGFRKPRGQVCKRIGRRIAELGLEGPRSYRRRLEEDPGEWSVLDGLCRVTISRFFRDRGVWGLLCERALPELAAGAGVVRAWSAGCGSGEEPYSLSILWRLKLAGRFPDVDLRIVATDAGREVLERARAACYGRGTLKEMEEPWIQAAFRGAPSPRDGGEEPLCLRPRFRKPVAFRREDLRETMPEGPFHLVFCRNLAFTYFGRSLQERLLKEILVRLAPGGRLVIGAHEGLPPGEWSLRRDGPSEPVFVKESPLADRVRSPRL